MKISIVEDESDTFSKSRGDSSRRGQEKPENRHSKTSAPAPPKSKEQTKDTQRNRESDHVAPSAAHGNSQRIRSAENESRRSDSPRNSREPEPIHIHLARAESGSKQGGSTSPKGSEPHQAGDNRPYSREIQLDSKPAAAPNPQVKQLQSGAGVSRTPSFQKKRESQKRRSIDMLGESDKNENSSNVRYPTGSGTGTLADLKKQRSESHKFGNGLDAQVQSLFLHSLNDDSKKYSSSGVSSSPNANNKESSAQNGKNVKNNNNNINSGQSRPPTFISDSGPLRRFSAPTSSPVVGDDDKFKNDCCVIL